MENQIYRLRDGAEEPSTLEFWLVDTNELDPYKEIKEIAITIDKKEIRIDFELNTKQTESLIKYLEESLEYIKEYNEASKPKNK